MANRYAIKDLSEATEYLAHPVLGKRLKEIASVFRWFSWSFTERQFNWKIHARLLDVPAGDNSAEDKLAAAKRLTAMTDEVGFNYLRRSWFQ
jgi:uncharacterized protein (DUF1810 family)